MEIKKLPAHVHIRGVRSQSCGGRHFWMRRAKGGVIFFFRNGYQPSSARTACSLNSVAPHIKEAPNIPSSAEPQELAAKREAHTSRMPSPITYGHHNTPRNRSPRITQKKPRPIM